MAWQSFPNLVGGSLTYQIHRYRMVLSRIDIDLGSREAYFRYTCRHCGGLGSVQVPIARSYESYDGEIMRVHEEQYQRICEACDGLGKLSAYLKATEEGEFDFL